MNKKNFTMAIATAAAAGLLIAAPAFADPATGPRPGMGPGMMGGYGAGPGTPGGGEEECDMGPGMTGGYGQGYGPGPGMMGGYGHGYGMGPGMMGGYGQGSGMGPGMMGGYGQGYGMGPGMMGYGGAPGLTLNEEQRAKAIKIQDGTRKKMWESMGAMFDASSKLRDLLSAPTRDRAAISVAYKQLAELRQKMFEIGLDAQDAFEQILSADQRKQLRR
jgi:Spy/CpxP family protein refolding chaperone